MKDYEVKDTPACHVFMDADNYEDLLSSINNWWHLVTDEAKTIETIVFTVDDDGSIKASVFWNYLTTEMAARLESVLMEPREIPEIKSMDISEN